MKLSYSNLFYSTLNYASAANKLRSYEDVTKSYDLGDKSFKKYFSNVKIVILNTSNLAVAAFANVEEHDVNRFKACFHPK